MQNKLKSVSGSENEKSINQFKRSNPFFKSFFEFEGLNNRFTKTFEELEPRTLS